MGKTWTAAAVRYLENQTMCPRCDFSPVGVGRCPNCGVDLASPAAAELREASSSTAAWLNARQVIIDRLPVLDAAPVVAPLAAPTPAAVSAPLVAAAISPRSESQVSVQSVLAVAGAGLFAVAAIVFTFLNPDLTDFATRTSIIAAATLIFLGGAWLLAKKELQFSAEAIGALGAVFVVLDIWAFTTRVPTGISGWVFAAIGTLLTSVVLVLIAAVRRVRTWLWAGLVGLAITPAFIGYATDNRWGVLIGHVAVGFAAVGTHEIARRLSTRFGSGLRAEHGTASVLQILVVAIVLVQLFFLDVPSGSGRVLGSAAIIGALALLALLTLLRTTGSLARLWGFSAGALAVVAVALLPVALTLNDSVWFVTLVPLAAVVALTAIALMLSRSRVQRPAILIGGLVVGLVTVAPAVGSGVAPVLTAITRLMERDIVNTSGGNNLTLAAILGLSSTAAGLFATSRLHARTASPTSHSTANLLALALWLGVLAVAALTTWGALVPPAQAAIGLGSALALSALLSRVPAVAAAPAHVRAPLVTAAHLLPVLVAMITWVDPNIRVLGGAAVVATLFAVALTVPKGVRPVHVGFGFAYALVVFAAGLNLAGLETIAVLCLTTSLASICALIATLAKWLTARSWYAVLIVTAIPFIIGIISVLNERSGWTALSTGVTFALALALVLTRRPGLTRVLRAVAAALLVPALAVVVICLGAQFLDVSGSPITLPIIAVIVACTLPSTGLIGAALVRHGLSEADARISRLWIEISALVTTAFAVLLALVRSAAGLPTTFLVLVIIGIGAIATAVFAKRQYAWPVAAASWTGALWCVWALNGVTAIEPYLLPPALGAAIVAAFLVWRGLPGIGLPAIGLYWTGLACAALPTLTILAFTGSGPGATVPWRTIGLLGGSLLFLILGALNARTARSARFATISTLRTPTLAVAMAAAAAGAIQAVRWGWNLDALDYGNARLVMLPVLGLSALALLLAAASARLLIDGTSTEPTRASLSRWLYAPALVYLVVGPMATIRPGWFPIFTLLGLTVLLLALMLVTVVRARTRRVTLPPVWFTFALAWCTAVTGWSVRDLRVEAFSLPLGLALLAAGVIALRPPKQLFGPATLNSWPLGFSSSWQLLTPGILVTLVPSILATGTDPRTERAILVIALALISILVGSLRRLAAPFILGIIALPVENLLVFVVQIGRNIGALPWWITLATAGAVLFVIAVTSERRVAGAKGTAARVRDLR
ncbi:MAG: hypothetical protein ABJB03_01375 [Rhodoglobus sp.]